MRERFDDVRGWSYFRIAAPKIHNRIPLSNSRRSDAGEERGEVLLWKPLDALRGLAHGSQAYDLDDGGSTATYLLPVAQLLVPDGRAALRGEVEEIPDRLERADVPGILLGVGRCVEEL